MGSKAYEKRGASGGWFFSFQVRGRTGTFVLALLWFLLPESARAQEGRTVVREPAGMRIYQSPYYILHSDLDEATVNETRRRSIFSS